MNIYFNVAYQGCALPTELKLYRETLPSGIFVRDIEVEL